MKILLSLSFLILFASLAFSQEYDARYEKLIKEYTLNPDGTQDYREIKEVRLNSHFAFHRLLGETFIIYNPLYEDLTINDSYTIMADGSKVEAPGNAFNELLPRFASNAPAHNYLREMAVTHTGLEVGALIHLDYTISSDSGYYPVFMGHESLLENVPVDHLDVIIKIPEEESLRFRVLNIRTAPNVFMEDGYKVYRWSFSNLKPHSLDTYADHSGDPFLYFSSTDLQRAFFRFVDQPAFRHLLDKDLKSRADSIGKSGFDELDKILKIRDIVFNELNLRDIPLKYTGYRLRSPEHSWADGYGTVLERAVLLADLLMYAGINAYPVAGMADEHFSRDYGNLDLMEKFYVQVNPVSSDRLYLSVEDKNNQNLIYRVPGMTFIQLDGAIESVRTFNEMEEPNELSINCYLSLSDSSGLNGEMEFEVTNGWNPFFDLRNDSSFVKRYINPGKYCEKIELDRLTQSVSSGKATLNDSLPFNIREGYLFFDLPGYGAGMKISSLVQPWLEETSAVELPCLFSKKYDYSITLPEEWRLVNDKIEISSGNEVGTVHMVLRQDGNLVTIQKYMEISNRKIDRTIMEELLDLARAWTKGNISTLIFTKKQFQESDP